MLVFIIKLAFIQIIDESYKQSAVHNSRRTVTQFPARGLIYDRNQKLLVYNQAIYDVMIIPRQVTAFDTTDFCRLLKIEKKELKRRIKKAKRYSYRAPSLLLKQISSKTYAILQEKMYKFNGFFVQSRTLRKYPRKSAAHALGFLNEVNRREINADNYYQQGDYIGKNGIELTYEKYLRGEKGEKVYWIDAHNRIKGSYKDGRYDKSAVKGKNIYTSLDIELQEYGEKLMQNKKGGIVAIDPQTGEILAKISSPSYNPEMLVGRVMSKNYTAMVRNDSLKPLFDRSLMALYAPGSIFKPINALIGLHEEVITPSSRFECHEGYKAGNLKMGCHWHASPLNLKQSIMQSCNAYYCNVYRKILENPKYASVNAAYEMWREKVMSFGIGRKLGTDLPHELSGSVPTLQELQKKVKTKRLHSLYIISMAIGQGELLITPLQMANMTAAIANRGFYYTPHIVKRINDIPTNFNKKHFTAIDTSYFNPVIDGMQMVVESEKGTGRLAAIPDITVCGKTGTVQTGQEIEHSVFAAFAPRENPKIAIVVYVENGKWGSWYGAPIAGLMIEKYLKGEISKEKRKIEKDMLKADLINQINIRTE